MGPQFLGPRTKDLRRMPTPTGQAIAGRVNTKPSGPDPAELDEKVSEEEGAAAAALIDTMLGEAPHKEKTQPQVAS